MIEKKIYHKMDTSTDVDPRNPKSWSLNGSDLRSSAVSWRNLAMISFWYLELVATVIGYHTWTRSVCNKHTQTRVLIKPCTTRCVFICTCTCTYTAALDDTYLLKFQCTFQNFTSLLWGRIISNNHFTVWLISLKTSQFEMISKFYKQKQLGILLHMYLYDLIFSS